MNDDKAFDLGEKMPSGIKITFGLQPKHIEKIEAEINRWDEMSHKA